MNEHIVEKQLSYLIVPFGYKKNYKEIHENINLDYFSLEDPVSNRLFDHIEDLISNKEIDKEAIGKRYLMLQRARKKYNLPNKTNDFLTYKMKNINYYFSIESVEIYFFETQVGFIVYQIGFPKDIDINSLIETNYYAKKLNSFSKRLYYLSEDNELDLGNLSRQLIEPFEIDTFFEGENEKPSQAIVFSSILLKEKMNINSIPYYLFLIRRSFKSTYKPSKNEEGVFNHPNILPLFENSFWGVSLEGVANIITKTDDTTTNNFFSGTYFGNLKTTYFYMYILALHQKYALLYLTKQFSFLPQKIKQIKKPTKQNQLIAEYKEKLVDFMLKSSYRHISNVSHYDDLYHLIRDNLKIQNLLNDLHNELEVLSAYTQTAEQKQKERFNNKIGLLSAVFLPITITIEFFGMNNVLTESLEDNWYVFIGITVVLYIISTILYKFWWED